MPTLIRSKLQVPTPSGLLHRSRLCQALERGLDRKLTIISAPAGYGKTSALVDFARHVSVPVCWYTVDERDRDVNLFIRYVIGAIQEQFPGFGEQARVVIADRDGDLFREPTAVVADLVNEMLDLQTDFVLVFDNFEPVDGALGIREFVRRMIEVLPANCHLMLGSRVLPDVPVTQLVAKRELVGVTEEDLRFTAREVRELLARSHVQVSDSQAAAIASSSEGWITGVLLLADLLREDAAATVLDADRATAQTYGYLATEVLERQPPDVRRFLRTSSCLREMSARLCRDALGLDGAHSLLGEIERRNLFVTRFGEGGGAAYRYHKLFRDFLQRQLRGREPGLYEDLHRRAGAWFEQEHNVEEAVHHYLAAEAYPEATELMERVAMEWFTCGRVETLLGWAEAMPEDVRSQAPRLALYQSKILTDRYEYEEARSALVSAEAGFASRQDDVHLARVHIQRGMLGVFEGRHQDVIDQSKMALSLLGEDQEAERAKAQRLVGKAYVAQGCFQEGVEELEEALSLLRRVGGLYNVVTVLQDIAVAYASHAFLDEAAARLSEALPLARRLGSASQLAGVLNNLAWLRHAAGQYRDALKLYEEGLAAARRANDPRSEANIAEGMATVYRDVGHYQRAELLYDVAWQIASGSRPDLALLVLVSRADLHRWQGDVQRALTLLRKARALAERKGLGGDSHSVLLATEGIAVAESGDVAKGLDLLSTALEIAKEREVKGDLARCFFLKAEAHILADEEEEALDCLRRAMDLALSTGTDQFAVVEGRHATNLLELGDRAGIDGCSEIADKAAALRSFGQDLMAEHAGEARVDQVRLEVRGFGGGSVVRNGEPVSSSDWRAAMAKELFFYILLEGPVERDAAGLVFWPDLPTDKVTSNFHSTLYRVRQAVGSDVIVLQKGRYTVGVDYWFDLEEFEGLVERARMLPSQEWQARDLWQRAVGLYRGDLLPEVDRAWCVPKREQARDLYIEALVELGLCCEAQRAYEQAITVFRRALTEDSLREDIYRHMMRAFVRLGRRSDALSLYFDCRDVLRQELGIEPSQQTEDLYNELSGQAVS